MEVRGLRSLYRCIPLLAKQMNRGEFKMTNPLLQNMPAVPNGNVAVAPLASHQDDRVPKSTKPTPIKFI